MFPYTYELAGGHRNSHGRDRSQKHVKIAPDHIHPALLFQRFLVVSRSGDISLEEVLTYELSPYPPALFEIGNILRKADKPQLVQAIRDHATDLSSEAVKKGDS